MSIKDDEKFRLLIDKCILSYACSVDCSEKYEIHLQDKFKLVDYIDEYVQKCEADSEEFAHGLYG